MYKIYDAKAYDLAAFLAQTTLPYFWAAPRVWQRMLSDSPMLNQVESISEHLVIRETYSYEYDGAAVEAAMQEIVICKVAGGIETPLFKAWRNFKDVQ